MLCCEGPIKEHEVKIVVKNMKNNKSPGTDGFPAEFYKFFWLDINKILIRAASRVAVLPVRHGIVLNPPSNVSVGIPTKVFILQIYVNNILKSTNKYTKWH